MSHTWLYRHYKDGTCTVCQARDERLVPNGKGHYVCMDAEGCYARWKSLDPAGISHEEGFTSPFPPRPPRRRRR